MIVLEIVAFVAGVALVISAVMSAVKTLVIPRAEFSYATRALFLALRAVFDLIAPPRRSFRFRDRVRNAYYAPIGLLLLPVMWVTMILLGVTAIFWATGVRPASEALITSGSSMFTLGFVRPGGTGRTLLAFVEAAFGLAILSLMISYLPTIYGAYQRREATVGMLEARGGLPPSPVTLLVRYQRIGWLDGIAGELFPRWESWFVDIEESHTSQPALVFFRSPHPERSWITAAGCVLDTAALVNSTIAVPHDPQADMTLRSGFLALRRIADYFGIAYDADPSPRDPISITREEYDDVCVRLEAAGVPLVADRDAAWLGFAGWRVNYDSVLIALCALVMAPPGTWSSDKVTGPRPRPHLFARKRLR